MYDNNPNPNYVETLIIDFVFEGSNYILFS